MFTSQARVAINHSDRSIYNADQINTIFKYAIVYILRGPNDATALDRP